MQQPARTRRQSAVNSAIHQTTKGSRRRTSHTETAHCVSSTGAIQQLVTAELGHKALSIKVLSTRNMATVARPTFSWQVSFTNFVSLVARDETLSDQEVINAIIGLLFGATCDKLVQQPPPPERTLQVKSSVRLAHVSTIASQSFLKQWLRYGQDMTTLLEMLYPEPGSSGDVLHELSYSLTSYLYSLKAISHSVVVSHLATHANEYMKFTGDKKLHSFIRFLHSTTAQSMFQSVSLLSAIHNKIVEHPNFYSNHICTSIILNALYEFLDIATPELRTLVWNMFLDVLRPSLFFMEHMLDIGTATDPHDEFMFDINGKSVKLDPDFWHDCISLRSDDSVANIFKPILNELIIGIKSRLLLADCQISPKFTMDSRCLFDQFITDFVQIQEPRPRDNELDDQSSLSDSPNDHSLTESLSESPELKNGQVGRDTQNDSDSGLDSPYEIIESHQGNLLDTDVLAFKNVTPMDVTYYNVDDWYPRIKNLTNPDFNQPNDLNGSLPYSLPSQLKMPLKLAIERSLYPLIRAKAGNASKELMDAFRPDYNRHLKYYIDYWLMQKQNHSISLYLDSLFSKITFQAKDRVTMDTFYFEESADIRAVILYAPHEVSKEPLKILERLDLYYEDMDPFSRLLLNGNFRQIMSDAFHFLVRLKYAKWILEQVNLRFHMNEHRKELSKHRHMGKFPNHKHELFCFRFKCIKAIDSLIDTIMFELNESAQLLFEQAEKSLGFDDLKASLDKFSRSVRTYTFQLHKEKTKNVLTNITLTSTKLFELCQLPDFSWDKCKDLSPEKLRKKVEWMGSIANVVGDRSSDFVTL